MLVITAGRTGPNRSVRFGGDLSLDDRGRRDVLTLRTDLVLGPSDTVVCGPERAARETCELLVGGQDAVDDRLRTLDVGAWDGRVPEEVPPDELGLWFGDPAARPHGGETITEFVDRIDRWRVTIEAEPTICVVAMPVAQALLATDADGYFAAEVRPATVYDLQTRGQ
ncbi:histidine phosphatase family protein [Gordonia sp. ABSL11-1]|uniref:histidine phosphatase family protein n=1 Tax=Gordonia sp. ABSL11-1 TaxID=3053924 RepID=UPI0025726D3A|nr:histidine phosphatase family protein [Gordonia sp. ABSL11-1]MDL9945949.1 histidine phosphatase family protein [Gordonia sp. ABSL11-1]